MKSNSGFTESVFRLCGSRFNHVTSSGTPLWPHVVDLYQNTLYQTQIMWFTAKEKTSKLTYHHIEKHIYRPDFKALNATFIFRILRALDV